MSMAKCKNTILSRSLNDSHHQVKRSSPIDHHGHHHGHSHHTGTSHHGHHGSSSSSSSSHHNHHHGHHHGHHNNTSSSASGSTVTAVAHAHQHNHHAHTHHQQPPQIAHHHSFHPSTSHHHHHPHHGNFNTPTSDPLPTSLYVKHVMSSSSSATLNSNSGLVSATDHHHSPHHHSSHHSSHHGSHHSASVTGGSHHNSSHPSPSHHSSPHHSHHNFHHLHNNYSIYGDSSTPERDLLSSSSSSGPTNAAHLSISSRNLSHGGGGHESSLSPNMGTISTTALELSTHTYHGEDHATASPPSLITRRSHWSEVTGVNENTGAGAGGKGLSMEGASGGGEAGTDGDGDGSDSGSANLNPSTPQSIYDSSMSSAIDNSSSSLLTPSLKKAKRQPQPIPDNCKDDAYWERRRRNNESAKRSRESRRIKEHQTHLKVKMLEQENMRLTAKVSILENEVEKLRKIVYDRREGNGVIINSDEGRDSNEKTSNKMLH